MPQAAYIFFWRLATLSCLGIYSIAAALPSALLFWAAASSTSTSAALGQTPIAPSHSEDQRSSPQELLEQARQRLIEHHELPSPAPTAEPNIVSPQSDADFDRYRLGPGDSLFVNVLRFPDLSLQGTIDSEGNLIIPIAGALALEGLTLPEAEERIRSELNQYVINPEVDIALIAQRSVVVTLLGEIVRPGLYPLAAPNLATALVSAGGTTGLADLRTVRIRRPLANKTFIERNVDLFTPLQSSGAVPDVRLANGDIVIVPTLTASDGEDYDRNLVARSTLAREAITIRVLNYAAGGRGAGARLVGINLPNGSRFLDALTSVSPDVDGANLRKIGLVRFDLEQGKAVTQEIDGRLAIGGDDAQNPPLENNDVIIIGRNFVGRITYALNSFTQPFRDILGFLLFFDSLRDSANNLFGPGNN